MQPDNLLGAPTEGLGQTPTFVPRVNAGAATLDPGNPGRTQSVIIGSFGPGIQRVQGGPQQAADPTLRFLAKLGANTANAYSKEAQARDFVTGMQRAMAGEAVEDIAAEQPWYSRIFGDADVVEGARAYDQEARVQQLMGTLDAAMPKLREYSEDEATKFYHDTVQKSMTGHAATDAHIMGAFQRALPSFMKQRSKENYAFLQTNAAALQSKAVLATADRISGAVAAWQDGKLTDEDFEERTLQVASAGIPVVGQDMKSWQSSFLSTSTLLAEKGNFHALNAFEKIGAIALLTPEQQVQYTRTREANEAQTVLRTADKYLGMLTTLRKNAERVPEGWTEEATLNMGKAINTLVRRETGASRPLISTEALAAYGERTDQAIQYAKQRAAEAAAKAGKEAAAAADKDGAERIKASTMRSLLASGNATLAKSEYTNSEVDQMMLAEIRPAVTNPGAPEMAARWDMLVRNVDANDSNPLVVSQLRASYAGATVQGQPSPSFATAYEQWRQVSMRSPDAAVRLWGDEANARFDKFRLIHPEAVGAVGPGSEAWTAFTAAFDMNTPPKRKRLEAADRKLAIDAAVKKMTNGFFSDLSELRADQRQRIEQIILPYAEVHAENLPAADAGALAVASAKRDGAHMYGGYIWQDRKIGNLHNHLQSLTKTTLPVGSEVDGYIENELTVRAAASGMKSNIVAHSNGKGLVLAGIGDDGNYRYAELTYQDMANGVTASLLKKRTDIDKRAKAIESLTTVQPSQGRHQVIDPATQKWLGN